MLCTKHSETPFRIADADINIYSIEELAYYLYHNAYFVDESFFNEALIEYIDSQLCLKKIAKKLQYLSGAKTEFTEKVMTVVAGSRYYAENELKDFEKELKSISSKSMLERMYARARMLYENGRLLSAKAVYENILKSKNTKEQDSGFYAQVYVGIGEVLCRMFYFHEAIDEFYLAYERDSSKDILKHIINAKLMWERIDGKAADFSKENEIDSELVEGCRQEFNDMETQIKSSADYDRIAGIFEYDGRHNLDDYYENMQETLDEWKEEYRSEL